MLAIAWSLLGGWVLSLFGFQGVVIAGMLQVFGVTINALGYYFLFGMFGALRRLVGLNSLGKKQSANPTVELTTTFDKLSKGLNNFGVNTKKK